MKKSLLSAAALLSVLIATPASGAVVVGGSTLTDGQSTTLNFNGTSPSGGAVVDGLTASLTLTFLQQIGEVFNFEYALTNTSSVDSRVTAFGFNTDPNSVVTSSQGTVFTNFMTGMMPGLGNVEICFTSHNCSGGGNGGLADGASTTGSFSLNPSGTPLDLILSDFAVRYQSINTASINGGSGTGTVVAAASAVPEPATWAMMLLGFGAMGVAMRRRRSANTAQIA